MTPENDIRKNVVMLLNQVGKPWVCPGCKASLWVFEINGGCFSYDCEANAHSRSNCPNPHKWIIDRVIDAMKPVDRKALAAGDGE